jgi:hypothetical protein
VVSGRYIYVHNYNMQFKLYFVVIVSLVEMDIAK